jgi:hypothetical protein
MLREDYIKDTAKTLNQINYQIAELTTMKSELEQRLAAALEHGSEEQRTYNEGRYKIIIRSGIIYSLNKEEYEILGKRLPVQFDFVNKSVKYDINKKIIRDIYSYGSKSDIDVLESIVTKKPAKLNVTITSAS